MERIGRLLSALRLRPARGDVVVGSAKRSVMLAPATLATVMDASGLAAVPYRELDAAARAYLDGDAVPLERLVAESYVVNEAAGGAQSYSRALFMAVSCADYPQAYDMRLTPAARRIGWNAALRQKRTHAPGTFAPFTIDEWLDMAPDYSTVKLCLDWPAQTHSYPPGNPVPPNVRFPRVPVLVISGDLDTITTSSEGAAAAKLFPRSTHVIAINGAHVNALGDPYDCASRIARRFVEVLKVENTGCLRTIPEIRTVPLFARRSFEMPPALAGVANDGDPSQLQAAAAATQTVGDVVARASWLTGDGSGLRGGTYAVANRSGGEQLRLNGYGWTEDLPVSGVVNVDRTSGAVDALVTVSGPSRGTLSIKWNSLRTHARAAIAGTLDGRRIRATIPAP
jgi:pimeloyl-ACP methyl ester carboxylesterase